MQVCLVGLMLAERQVGLGRPSGRLVPNQLFPLSLLGPNYCPQQVFNHWRDSLM